MPTADTLSIPSGSKRASRVPAECRYLPRSGKCCGVTSYLPISPGSGTWRTESILSDATNAYQSELSSVTAMWQSADAVAMQHVDALLSMEAGAMGMSKDTLMRDLLFASPSSPNGV